MNILQWFKNFFGGKGKNSAEDKFNLIIIRKKKVPFFKEGTKVYVALPDKKKVEISVSKEFKELPEECCKILGKNGSASVWYLKTNYESKDIKIGEGYFTLKGDNMPNPQQGKESSITIQIDKTVFNPEFIESVRSYLKKDEADIIPPDETPQNEDIKLDDVLLSSDALEEDIKSLQEVEDSHKDNFQVNNPVQNDEDLDISEDDVEPLTNTHINFGETDRDSSNPKDAERSVVSNEDTTRDSGNESTISKLAKDFAELEQEKQSFRKWVIEELKKMNKENEYGKDLPLNTLLNKLKEEIDALKSKCSNAKESADEASRLRAKVDSLKKEVSEKDNLKKEYETLKISSGNNSRKIRDLESELNQKKEDLKNTNASVKEKEGEILALSEKIKKQETDLQTMDEELSVLRTSEVGQLKAHLEEKVTQISNLNDNLTEIKVKLDIANADIENRDTQLSQKNDQIQKLKEEKSALKAQLNTKTNEVTRLDSDLKKANDTISKKTDRISVLEKEKSTLEETITEKDLTIESKDGELSRLSNEKCALEENLNQRDESIKKLNNDKDLLSTQKSELQGLIHNDVESQIGVYCSAADALNRALEPEFLKECDMEAETDTVESMCAKIRKGIALFSKAISALKDENFESNIALGKAYQKIVEDNIESHAFTEIARWWAYSHLPFVVDKTREEGRGVEISSIDAAYAALSQILTLAGYRYQIPVLFVQNLKDGDYNNVTGSEQMNLDYQLPNVRAHVENIDRCDRENVILDIVQLGYYKDNQLVKKTSVIV